LHYHRRRRHHHHHHHHHKTTAGVVVVVVVVVVIIIIIIIIIDIKVHSTTQKSYGILRTLSPSWNRKTFLPLEMELPYLKTHCHGTLSSNKAAQFTQYYGHVPAHYAQFLIMCLLNFA
jgi:heme/copper-type cytochrome/quinol oxidase subunit 2